MSKYSRLDHYTGSILEIGIAALKEGIGNALMALLKKTSNFCHKETTRKCVVLLQLQEVLQHRVNGGS